MSPNDNLQHAILGKLNVWLNSKRIKLLVFSAIDQSVDKGEDMQIIVRGTTIASIPIFND